MQRHRRPQFHMAEEQTEAASGEMEGYKEAEARFFKGLTYHGE